MIGRVTNMARSPSKPMRATVHPCIAGEKLDRKEGTHVQRPRASTREVNADAEAVLGRFKSAIEGGPAVPASQSARPKLTQTRPVIDEWLRRIPHLITCCSITLTPKSHRMISMPPKTYGSRGRAAMRSSCFVNIVRALCVPKTLSGLVERRIG